MVSNSLINLLDMWVKDFIYIAVHNWPVSDPLLCKLKEPYTKFGMAFFFQHEYILPAKSSHEILELA